MEVGALACHPLPSVSLSTLARAHPHRHKRTPEPRGPSDSFPRPFHDIFLLFGPRPGRVSIESTCGKDDGFCKNPCDVTVQVEARGEEGREVEGGLGRLPGALPMDRE